MDKSPPVKILVLAQVDKTKQSSGISIDSAPSSPSSTSTSIAPAGNRPRSPLCGTYALYSYSTGWVLSVMATFLTLLFLLGAAPEAWRGNNGVKGVEASTGSLTDYVLPFMGSENGGNMFPGVTLPFGMVKIGPDVNPPSGRGDPYSGYHPLGNITGFSMMHESGTGGAPKYGVVSQLPVLGNISNPLLNYQTPRAQADQAEVGYYTTSLSNGVKVELTATQHAGIMRHSFSADAVAKGGNVLVDVSHFLPSTRNLGIDQHYIAGSIEIRNDGSYTGHGTYDGGWNKAVPWDLYFCGKFDQNPVSSKTFVGTGTTLTSYGQLSEVTNTTSRVGAIFGFGGASATQRRWERDWSLSKRQNNGTSLVVESRIGISFLSTDQACNYIDEEIPDNTSFGDVVDKVKAAWNDNVLSKISTTSTNTTSLQLIYGSLYGMFLIPSDRTGENPGWDSDEPYYDDIFTLWDLFRSHTPLFHILQPERYTDYIRSLIDVWRHDGWMPDGRSSNYNGRVQGGSNADNVLADAYVKGVQGGINWDDGFDAMKTDAEVTPPPSYDPNTAPDTSSTHDGRGALPDWKEHGFITTKFSRSVSRAVEYSVNDFALYTVGSGLGKEEADTYLERSKNWRNHWNPDMTISNKTGYAYTGFVSDIVDSEGTFYTPTRSPLDDGGGYWANPYYQGLPFEYSFGVHHDMKELVTRMGGDSDFISRLEMMFEPGSYPKGDDKFGKTIFNPGNEPSFASPYLFNFVPGNQWRSVRRSRYIANTYYNTGVQGLPGNSDAGAMQSWLLWTYIGLYPMTGSTTFLIAAPRLEELEIDLGNGKSFKVTSSGGDEATGAYYVQSLKVNGEEWTKSWVSWDDVFKNGGTMEFELGSQPVQWDTSEERPNWGLTDA